MASAHPPPLRLPATPHNPVPVDDTSPPAEEDPTPSRDPETPSP